MSEKIKLTEAELDILGVLWTRHGTTVREVYVALSEERKTSYTTFLKLMQIMHEKGLVERDEEGKAHIYYAKVERVETGRQMLGNILQKVFFGSAIELVEQVLELQLTSPKEMKKIRKMIKQNTKDAKEKKK